MKLTKKIFLILVFTFSLLTFNFLLSTPISAQVTNPIFQNADTDIANPQAFMNRLIQTIMTIFMIVGTIYFLWHVSMAAYHLMASEGDKGKLETAQREITQAAIGIGALFSIFAILKLIGIVFGIESLQNSLRLTLPSL